MVRSRYIAWALLASATACTCGTGVRSLSPKIVVTPLQVTFTDTPLGTTAQFPVEVTNVGAGALIVSGVTPVTANDITVPQSGIFTQDCEANPRTKADPMILAAGECARFQISFAPSVVETLTNTVNVTSNDPLTPTVPVQVTADGVLAPYPEIQVCVLDAAGMQTTGGCTNFAATPPAIPTIDFGMVQYGQATTQTLSVLSIGTSSLIVSNMRVTSSSPDFALTGEPSLPDTIAVSGSSQVQVVLTPSASGAITGKVVFLSNDPNNPEVDIPITAQEAAPCLAVSPTSLSFGPLVLGTTQMQSVNVTNCGLSAYQITTLDFVPTNASSTVYTLSSGDPSGVLPTVPFTFNPGDVHTLNLTYAPTAATTGAGDTGQINIVTGYGDTQVVPVVGTAIAEPQIQVCVLDPTGAVNPAECSNLTSSPPFIPTLNFGTVEYMQTDVRAVRVLNLGQASLSVSAVALMTATTDLTLPSPPATPVTIAGGGSTDVQISLIPTGGGAITAALNITSDDPNNPNVSVPIIAQEDPPCLQVTPVAIDFGTVLVGTSAMSAMSITNCGKSSYQITAWNFVPTVAGSTVFAVTPGDPSGGLPAIPFNFNPGDVHTLNLTYTPTSPTAGGGDTGQFNVTTSYGLTTPVPVVGQGAAQPKPQIEVCVLDASGNQVAADCTNFATTPPFIPTLDFGTVEYEQTTTRTVRVLNIGQAALSVSGLNLSASTSDVAILSAPALPVNVAAGGSVNVQLSLTPTGGGAVTGQLVVASNDPANPSVPIPIVAQEDPPCLQVTPTAINFGTVTVGNAPMQSVSITNCGQSTYSISQWSFAPTNASSTVFSVTPGDPSGTLPAIPFTFAPGAVHTLNITYKPTAATTGSGDTGQFTISTSYGATRTVPVVAQAAEPVPVCGGTNAPVARIAVTENGAAVTGSVVPLTTVTLNGAGSTVPSGASISSYTWTLLSAPPSSSTALVGSGANVTLLCSIVGTYQVELLVTDSAGCTSAQTTVNIDVVPGSGLHVQLTWAENYGDLDLHYLDQGGTFFDQPLDDQGGGSDMYFVYAVHEFNGPGNPGAKLYPYGETGVSWAASSTENPSLDADQLWGYGPENATQTSPFDAKYTVMVHYYCSSAYDEFANAENFKPVSGVTLGNDPDCGDRDYGGDGRACYNYGTATPTVRVYWNGAQIWQGQTVLSAKDAWTAATIQVTSTAAPTVSTVSGQIVSTDYGCPDGN